MNCPTCKTPIPDKTILKEAASINGSKTSKAKQNSSRLNGKKGGRPRKSVKSKNKA